TDKFRVYRADCRHAAAADEIRQRCILIRTQPPFGGCVLALLTALFCWDIMGVSLVKHLVRGEKEI
ncbi:MAG: hypothetical protein IJN31_06175, partial [Peptococcaceae bacterium]|nr:hypothetical protein [Peptococcaceae bacterium]